jgi:hypothetical protein
MAGSMILLTVLGYRVGPTKIAGRNVFAINPRTQASAIEIMKKMNEGG